jgi:hypothetical protein
VQHVERALGDVAADEVVDDVHRLDRRSNASAR